MILALRLGRTLGELMDAIDTHELSLWREFNRQSPLGDERADLLAASLAAVVAQAAGAKVRVTDMLVRWDADDAQPSAEAGADALKAFLLSKVNKGLDDVSGPPRAGRGGTMMWKIMTNNSSSVAAQQALDNAVKQTTASLKAQTLECRRPRWPCATTTRRRVWPARRQGGGRLAESLQRRTRQVRAIAGQGNSGAPVVAGRADHCRHGTRPWRCRARLPRRTRWCTKPRAASSRARTRAPRTC